MGYFELALCPKCTDCPEFDSETRKEILHGDTPDPEVNIQIICKYRGLCDRIEEHLKNKLDNVSCTTRET